MGNKTVFFLMEWSDKSTCVHPTVIRPLIGTNVQAFPCPNNPSLHFFISVMFCVFYSKWVCLFFLFRFIWNTWRQVVFYFPIVFWIVCLYDHLFALVKNDLFTCSNIDFLSSNVIFSCLRSEIYLYFTLIEICSNHLFTCSNMGFPCSNVIFLCSRYETYFYLTLIGTCSNDLFICSNIGFPCSNVIFPCSRCEAYLYVTLIGACSNDLFVRILSFDED